MTPTRSRWCFVPTKLASSPRNPCGYPEHSLVACTKQVNTLRHCELPKIRTEGGGRRTEDGGWETNDRRVESGGWTAEDGRAAGGGWKPRTLWHIFRLDEDSIVFAVFSATLVHS